MAPNYLERRRRACFSSGVAAGFAICCSLTVEAERAAAQDALPAALYPVAATQVEYVEAADGRRLNYMLIYPAAEDSAAALFRVFLSINLQLSKDAPIAPDGLRRPPVVFSHGAGGNGAVYAWFGQGCSCCAMADRAGAAGRGGGSSCPYPVTAEKRQAAPAADAEVR